MLFKLSWKSLQPAFLSNLGSYDTRGPHAGTPSHWKDEEVLENRAIFRTTRSPAELVIKPIKVTLDRPKAGEIFCKKRSKTFLYA